MPHIVLEYSQPLPQPVDFQGLFAELHSAMVEMGDIRLIDIKSRAIGLSDWRLGDGDASHAFVHLKAYLLESDTRDTEYKRRLSAALQLIVAAYFARSLAEQACQLCFEVIDIRRDCYAKIVSPSLSY
ncbi:5-carboxymethyl-2-hydroxymuconate Delta-isomerase [Chitinimonas arctica]|uniref:5-carboxymethyl-2-hydroxymuconate Delta-isomerase n=1 Tax=Chitinimonas arctica TaxID=2594795 RepID=UPI0015D25D7E|nr:5-carboxymethyl-2-hydroxymuconate Delta-isomerase [Chitinimonas arctica]